MVRILPGCIILCLLIILQDAFGQSLGVNTSGAPAHSSSILDVSSTTKGVLVPRMTKAQKNAIAAPATGLLIFQESPDSIGFHFYNGSRWAWIDTAGGKVGWDISGNTGTNTTDHFFGTIDNVPLSFRQNNLWLGRWNSQVRNFLIGDSAGAKITSGTNNIGIGSKALLSNTLAYANVAIGNSALQNNSANLRNTAIGDSAMHYLSFGSSFFGDNTAIGSKALFKMSPTSTGNGAKNTVVGSEAMFETTTGYENTAMGVSALRENTTGAGVVAIGRSAARLSAKGNLNTYVGYTAGYTDSIGGGNTGVGGYALFKHQTSGSYNTAVGYQAMELDSAGGANVAIGYRALRNSQTITNSVAIGTGALEASLSGTGNVGVGRSAGFFSDTASYITAIGHSALAQNRRENNTALGAFAGYLNSYTSTDPGQGIENTLIGYHAMTGNAFGSQNTAVGFKAMSIFLPGTYSGTAPSRNVAVGDSALQANRGNDNVAIGYRSLAAANTTGANKHTAVGSRSLINTTASYPNTAVGYSSQDSTTTGYANTSIGSYSLTANKVGVNNTAIGNAAMYEAVNNVNGSQLTENTAVGNDALRLARYYGNTAIGAAALRNDTSGVYNTGVGYLAMYQNRSGDVNVAVGTSALRNNLTGSGNTALGTNAMFNHKYLDNNTAVGYEAMLQDTSGYANTALGWRSLKSNKRGFNNIAIGAGAMELTDSATFNVAMGVNALQGTAGSKGQSQNVAIGDYTLETGSNYLGATAVGTYAGNASHASFNTFIGYTAGMGVATPITGENNTGVGTAAIYNLTIGQSNSAFGQEVGTQLTTGNRNTLLGSLAGSSLISGSNNTLIGYNAEVSGQTENSTAIGSNAMVSANNALVLGGISGINGAPATVNVGIGTTAPASRLHLRRNGASGGSYIANASLLIEDNVSSFMHLSNPNSSENGILSGNANTTIRAGMVFGNDSSVMMRAGGNLTRMTVDGNGRIGIGTIAPLSKLHIYESTGNAVNARIASVSTSFEPGLELVKSGGGADWKFRISSSSNTLIISRALDDFAATPPDEYEFSVASFRPFTDGSNSLGISTNRWSTVYAVNGTINTSDARDKENISNLTYGLKEIMQLRPVSYTWKNDPGAGKKIGFIAQEVKPVLEEVVQTGDITTENDVDGNENSKNDRLGIFYSDIIPVTVKAIQEQQQQIELLKKENGTLKKELAEIKKKLGIQ